MNRSTLVERCSPLGCFPGQPTPRLYDRVVEVLRSRQYSPRTEEAYAHRIRRFTLFHAGAHPRELGEGPYQQFPDASGRFHAEGRWRFRLRPPGAGPMQVSLNMS
jgi:hypothetical protein